LHFFYFTDTFAKLDPYLLAEKNFLGAMKMIEEINQTTAIRMINDVGKEAWFVYSGLRFMANDSIVNLTQDQIAELLGMSKRRLQTHLKTLHFYRVGESPLIETIRTAEGYTYEVTAIKVKRSDSPLLESPKKTSTKKVNITNVLFDYWLQAYKEAYGDPYQVSNFAKEKSHVRQLANRYDGDARIVMEIMNVVIRLYPTRWKTAQYLRPTLGALVSWLAAQAEPMAKANLEVQGEADVQITVLDDEDVFAKYDKAWGIE
jgi:hypothetical protein